MKHSGLKKAKDVQEISVPCPWLLNSTIGISDELCAYNTSFSSVESSSNNPSKTESSSIICFLKKTCWRQLSSSIDKLCHQSQALSKLGLFGLIRAIGFKNVFLIERKQLDSESSISQLLSSLINHFSSSSIAKLGINSLTNIKCSNPSSIVLCNAIKHKGKDESNFI